MRHIWSYLATHHCVSTHLIKNTGPTTNNKLSEHSSIDGAPSGKYSKLIKIHVEVT